MAGQQGLLIIGEIRDGELSPTTAEVLSAGREVAEQSGTDVNLALLGSNITTAAQQAIQAGADRVYTVEDALLDTPQIDLLLAAFTEVVKTASPDMMLIGRTDIGRELAPRLACRLGVSLLQDCIRVEFDSESRRLTGTRPVYGGSVLARVRSTSTPQVVAIRPKSYNPLELDLARQGAVTPVAVTLESSMAKTAVLRQELDENLGVKLEDANIVVSGGRGLGGPEPFSELEELAGILGAGIGASRAAVDAGWVPSNWQIGLTGRTITPDLYITVGISGASQHMAGCSNSKVIVAINKDGDANIFREARYGVIGDWAAIIPAFMQAVRNLKGQL